MIILKPILEYSLENNPKNNPEIERNADKTALDLTPEELLEEQASSASNIRDILLSKVRGTKRNLIEALSLLLRLSRR